MVEKQTLHRGNWKTNHIHVHYSNILEYNYYRDGTYMYIHTCTFVHHNHRSFPTASNDAMYTYTYNDQMYTCWDMQNFLTGACTCRHGGNLRALSETTDMDSYSETVHQLPLSSAALTAVATLHLQPVHCDISVPSPAQSTLPFYWRLCTFIHSQWLLTVTAGGYTWTQQACACGEIVTELLRVTLPWICTSLTCITFQYKNHTCIHHVHIEIILVPESFHAP